VAPGESNASGAAQAIPPHTHLRVRDCPVITRTGKGIAVTVHHRGASKPLARNTRIGYPEAHCHDSSVSKVRNDKDRVSPPPVPDAIPPRQGVWLPFAPVQPLHAPALASSRVPCKISLRIARRPGSGFCPRTPSRASEPCDPGDGGGLRPLARLPKVSGEEIPPIEAALVRASAGSAAHGSLPSVRPPLPLSPGIGAHAADPAPSARRGIPRTLQVGGHAPVDSISRLGKTPRFVVHHRRCLPQA